MLTLKRTLTRWLSTNHKSNLTRFKIGGKGFFRFESRGEIIQSHIGRVHLCVVAKRFYKCLSRWLGLPPSGLSFQFFLGLKLWWSNFSTEIAYVTCGICRQISQVYPSLPHLLLLGVFSFFFFQALTWHVNVSMSYYTEAIYVTILHMAWQRQNIWTGFIFLKQSSLRWRFLVVLKNRLWDK